MKISKEHLKEDVHVIQRLNCFSETEQEKLVMKAGKIAIEKNSNWFDVCTGLAFIKSITEGKSQLFYG